MKREFEVEGAAAFPGKGHARDKELVRLKRELARVALEEAQERIWGSGRIRRQAINQLVKELRHLCDKLQLHCGKG